MSKMMIDEDKYIEMRNEINLLRNENYYLRTVVKSIDTLIQNSNLLKEVENVTEGQNGSAGKVVPFMGSNPR